MSKNQKKPTPLSMGGIMPRRPKSVDTIKRLEPQNLSIVKIKKGVLTKKKAYVSDKASSWRIKLRNNSLLTAVSLFIAGLYLFDVNNFPPHQSSQPHFDSTADIKSAEYLPMKASLLVLSKLHINFQIDLRLLSVAIMFFSLFCFYKLVCSWISRRMAALSVLLYGSSSWALFQTRGDNLSVMMLGLVPILLYTGNLLINSKSNLGKFVLSVILIQFIFVPGAVWFFILGIITCLVFFRERMDLGSFWFPIVVMAVVLAGDIAAIIHLSLNSYTQFIKLAGIDSGSIPSLNGIWSNIYHLPGQIFVSGTNNSSLWLPSTPIIDWVSVILMLSGLIYLAISKIHPARKTIIFTFLALAVCLIFINGTSYISILLPILYLAIAAGVTYLLDQWMEIFPSNPLARSVGLTIVCLVVLLVCGYHIERYFIGWPKTDGYHQIFKS